MKCFFMVTDEVYIFLVDACLPEMIILCFLTLMKGLNLVL